MRLLLLFILCLLISTFTSAQSITGINPNEGNAGGTLNVTITGANTNFTQATNTVSFYFFGATTTATYPNSLNVINNQALMANITIPQGTPVGTYSFSVSNIYDGYMYSASSFKVNTPFINSITPNEGTEGTTLNVTISGINTNFTKATNTVVRFYFFGATSTATYPNSVNVQTDQTLTANLSIPAGVIEDWYDFSVSNSLDGYMLKQKGFKVKAGSFVEELSFSDNIIIHPNPFKETLIFTLQSPLEEYAVIRIYNITGHLVDKREVRLVRGDNLITMKPDLKNGIYNLVLERSDGRVITRKIIRN